MAMFRAVQKISENVMLALLCQKIQALRWCFRALDKNRVLDLGAINFQNIPNRHMCMKLHL